MADYLALTEGTASWLIGKPNLTQSLTEALLSEKRRDFLPTDFYTEGPIRLAIDGTRTVLALWHVDYASGTGDEQWGFLSLSPRNGLRSVPDIAVEVLERSLYVASQRLRGLLLDAAMIHRAHPSGIHTCLAGRGNAARQMSLAYLDRDVQREQSVVHSIIICGPFRQLPEAADVGATEARKLDPLVRSAHETVQDRRRDRRSLPEVARKFRVAVQPFYTADPRAEAISLTTRSSIGTNAIPGAIFTNSYADWQSEASSLTEIQRRLIQTFPLSQHPLRIVGPAGSGKTLLMQLLAMRSVEIGKEGNESVRSLYVAHNAAMAETVRRRFETLAGLDPVLSEYVQAIETTTLTEFGRKFLDLPENVLFDRDAHGAKEFQREIVSEIVEEIGSVVDQKFDGPLLTLLRNETELRSILITVLAAEISVAIKGHGLLGDRQRYVGSQRSLSRLHGVLKQPDRELVFEIFSRYQANIERTYEVLDSDDLALTLLGRLKSPLWSLLRRKQGYDFVFVDETQLFNENERRIFPLLTNLNSAHVPIALALDDAQDLYGYSFSGLSTLGIGEMQNESLPSIHRSTNAIVRLALFIIGRSTDLFSADFPDFAGIADARVSDEHELAAKPAIVFATKGESVGTSLVAKIRELRKSRLKSIAVVVHASQYFSAVRSALEAAGLPLHLLLDRGQKLESGGPMVVLTRPEVIGGQEFDAVIVVGLEHGVSPPFVPSNEPLGAAVEQQAIREAYLSVSRARYRVVFVISAGRDPSPLVADARSAGLLIVSKTSE